MSWLVDKFPPILINAMIFFWLELLTLFRSIPLDDFPGMRYFEESVENFRNLILMTFL